MRLLVLWQEQMMFNRMRCIFTYCSMDYSIYLRKYGWEDIYVIKVYDPENYCTAHRCHKFVIRGIYY